MDAAIRFRRRNGLGTLETQVKSITPAQVQRLTNDGVLRYPLTRTRAEHLTETTGFPVGLFAVVEVPDDPGAWCERQSDDQHHLRLFSRSWWALVVGGQVPVPEALQDHVVRFEPGETATVRIDMHHERHLDVFSLNALLNAVAAWQTSKGNAA